MKTLLKIITLCLLLFSTTAHAAFISFTFTNVAYATVPDTNVFKLIPVSGPNANADGSFSTIGIGLRIVPPTNGLTVTNIGQNNWLVTNQFLGQGYYIRVPLDSGPTIYPSGSLLISGGNLFVTVVSGSGGTNIVTANQITNALGYPVLSPNQITNAAAQTTNGMTTIVYTNPATLVTQSQLTNAVQAQAVSNTNYANTAAQTQGINNTNFTLTVSNAVSTNSIGALIATNALLLSQINALNTSLLAAIAASAGALTNNSLNLSNSVTAALIASNVQQTANLNTFSNVVKTTKQGSSITLSNLAGTGAFTNSLEVADDSANLTITTEGNSVILRAIDQVFLTNNILDDLTALAVTNGDTRIRQVNTNFLIVGGVFSLTTSNGGPVTIDRSGVISASSYSGDGSNIINIAKNVGVNFVPINNGSKLAQSSIYNDTSSDFVRVGQNNAGNHSALVISNSFYTNLMYDFQLEDTSTFSRNAYSMFYGWPGSTFDNTFLPEFRFNWKSPNTTNIPSNDQRGGGWLGGIVGTNGADGGNLELFIRQNIFTNNETSLFVFPVRYDGQGGQSLGFNRGAEHSLKRIAFAFVEIRGGTTNKAPFIFDSGPVYIGTVSNGVVFNDGTNVWLTQSNATGRIITSANLAALLGPLNGSNAAAYLTPAQVAFSNFIAAANVPASLTNTFLVTIPVGATNLFLVANATNDASTVLRLYTVNATNDLNTVLRLLTVNSTNDLNTALRSVIVGTNGLLQATITAGDAAERAAMISTNATTTNSFITLVVAERTALNASNLTQNANLLSASNSILTGISAVSSSGLISNNIAGKGTNNTFSFATLNSVSMTGARLLASNNVIMLQTDNGDISFDPSCVLTIGAGQVGCAIIGSLNAANAGSFSTIISGGTASGPTTVGIASGISHATSINAYNGATNWVSDTFIMGPQANAFFPFDIVISDRNQGGMWWATTNNMMTINLKNGVSIGTTNANPGYLFTVNSPIWATGFSVNGGPQFIPSPFNTNTPAVVTNIVAALAATNTLTASNSVALWHGGFWNVLADFWTTNSPSTVTGAVQNIATVIFNSQGLTADNAYTNIAIAKAPVNTLLTNIIKLNFTNPVYGTLASFVWLPSANIFTNSLNGLFITNNLASGNYLLDTPTLSALFQLPNTKEIPGASWTAVNGVGTCFSGYASVWDALNSGIIVSNLNFNSFDAASAALLNQASSGQIGLGITGTNFVVQMTTNQTFKVFLNTNGFGELNVQNTSTGGTASSDWTTTADNGTASTNYFNGGINGSRFLPGAATGIVGSTNDTYLISAGGNSFYDVIGGGDLLYFVSQLTTAAAVVTNMSIGPAGLASSVPITINGAAVVTTNFSGTLTFTNNTTTGIKFVTPASTAQPSGLVLASNGIVTISGNGRTYTFDPVGQQIQGLNNLFSDGGTELLLQGNGSNLRLHAQTANGNFRFQVNNVTIATITGTNINSYGGIIASNGFSSYASNTLAPSAISFPATTVNWTNNTGRNIFLFIDNTGVTGTTTKINGVQIYSSLVGDVLLPLQPGEYFSETYTIGTPTATMKPE